MHERGVVKRDTLHRRRKCTEGVNETFTLFRAKRDAGTKTSALIQGGASGKARTTNEQRGKRLKRDQ